MRISDWSSDVCSSDLGRLIFGEALVVPRSDERLTENIRDAVAAVRALDWRLPSFTITPVPALAAASARVRDEAARPDRGAARSEERSVGKECVSTVRSRWSPCHEKNKKNKTKM